MADKNKDGSLDFDEILKLLNTLNCDVTKKYAKEMFDVSVKSLYIHNTYIHTVELESTQASTMQSGIRNCQVYEEIKSHKMHVLFSS